MFIAALMVMKMHVIQVGVHVELSSCRPRQRRQPSQGNLQSTLKADTSLGKSKSQPSSNQSETTNGSDRAEELEVGVEDESIDAAAEHGHASGEETGSNGVLAGDEQSD